MSYDSELVLSMANVDEHEMMTGDSYPALYGSADAASLKAQHTHLLLYKVYLGSLVLGGVTSVFTAIGSQVVNKWLYASLAVILIIGLLILWITRARQDDKIWFDGRRRVGQDRYLAIHDEGGALP